MTKNNKKPWPADPEGMNDDRAKWARAAVATFQNQTNLEDVDGLDTAISDLLADLAHLCDREDLNFQELLQRAGSHYLAETTPDGEPGQQFKFL